MLQALHSCVHGINTRRIPLLMHEWCDICPYKQVPLLLQHSWVLWQCEPGLVMPHHWLPLRHTFFYEFCLVDNIFSKELNDSPLVWYGWVVHLECQHFTVSQCSCLLRHAFCSIALGWLVVCHGHSHMIICDWPCLLAAPPWTGFIWTALIYFAYAYFWLKYLCSCYSLMPSDWQVLQRKITHLFAIQLKNC